ncbi:hypothetical protein N0M98_27125 [Paenibacillus doosanensis]|uniref:DUF4367 domain-containing protein n=1 Tax=Paenibacillus konkukensis TaxID=2020716 RepID=A0ABY4RTD2_9BACL|nr:MULTISPECIES: hypothetical protein [Paenibacillus]MCS7463782.1 hypothetical protein [Paenibacillus doosanensis]UQZ85280.1 hypothetical protein SK3146_04569 [Paenibacillus konkukensis]
MNDNYKKSEREAVDDAWTKLQSKLAQEPVQPRWAEWAGSVTAESTASPLAAPAAPIEAQQEAAARQAQPLFGGTNASAHEAKRSGSFGSWLHKRKKWVASAAAAAVVAVTLATPSGNQALAAILNKFRMQQLTVVQENELQNILNGAFGDGKSRESINTFGTFTNVSGKPIGELDPAEASKVLGHKIIVPADFDSKQKLYVSPSNTLTFKMNVDEVNKAMTRLGAKKLLPDSVDGKPISLETGSAIYLYVSKGEEEGQDSIGYSFSQMPVPTVTVDPSIPVSEALDAIIQFPLLPQSLKDSLRTAGVLQGGSVPLPLIESGQAEQIKAAGVDVILTSDTMDRGDQGKRTYYAATWVKDGQLYRIDGNNALTTREAMISKVTELIRS